MADGDVTDSWELEGDLANGWLEALRGLRVDPLGVVPTRSSWLLELELVDVKEDGEWRRGCVPRLLLVR